MNYHLIRTDDMLNGDGIRVVLFVSGCSHYCNHCHNLETWDNNSGKLFNETAIELIIKELEKDYISGITLSGGDPLYKNNLDEVLSLIKEIKNKFPNKNIWIYSGYTWEELDEKRLEIVKLCDIFCDGKFIEELADVNTPWVGSTNQRVIDIKKTLSNNNIPVLH